MPHQPSLPVLLVVDQWEGCSPRPPTRRERPSRGDSGSSSRRRHRRCGRHLTLRSDFVGHCGELILDAAGLRLDRVVYDAGHRISIARMGPAQLREVIEKPAQRVGLRLQAGLVERILQEIDSEAGALPLVADTLDLLWLRRQGALS